MRASPSAVLFVEHVDEGSLGGDSNTLALIQEGLSARVLDPADVARLGAVRLARSRASLPERGVRESGAGSEGEGGAYSTLMGWGPALGLTCVLSLARRTRKGLTVDTSEYCGAAGSHGSVRCRSFTSET